ncbi:hypothetical protein GUJ93_ZPchr0002g23984 [Zizania palustris]|uniref:Uncharacterized protein n=1 Tax=Zizania palustris TaxID=103762 RepID=A0A8J5RUG0_ZIZPA|nr:hypothetical protein GUJ93_ZPchr0002g23984 [Zizania palustris]
MLLLNIHNDNTLRISFCVTWLTRSDSQEKCIFSAGRCTVLRLIHAAFLLLIRTLGTGVVPAAVSSLEITTFGAIPRHAGVLQCFRCLMLIT